MFAKPGFQTTVPGAERGVPDVAGNGDPVTGYPVRVDGQNFVIGGTSAVSPLLSGLTLRLNQLAGRSVGDFNAFAYAHSAGFSDVTVGDNGDFSAAPGWDPTTGLGSPVGVKLLATLTSSTAGGGDSEPTTPVVGPSSQDTEQSLLDAFRAVRAAVDSLSAAMQVWSGGRQLPGAAQPSPGPLAAEPALNGLPTPRATTDTAVTEPSA
jgi:kumamolisin